jgi:hypothetical protein
MRKKGKEERWRCSNFLLDFESPIQGNWHQIIDALTKGEIDLAIMGQPPEGADDVLAKPFAVHPAPSHRLQGWTSHSCRRPQIARFVDDDRVSRLCLRRDRLSGALKVGACASSPVWSACSRTSSPAAPLNDRTCRRYLTATGRATRSASSPSPRPILARAAGNRRSAQSPWHRMGFDRRKH